MKFTITPKGSQKMLSQSWTLSFQRNTKNQLVGITVINQSHDAVWIIQGQHISTIHLVEDRTPSDEETSEIIHQFKVRKQQVNEVNTEKLNDFMISGNQVQMKRPVQ